MSSESTNPLSIRLAVRTPEVLGSLRRIVTELNGFQLQDDPKATRVDVLVLEIGADPVSELDTIRVLLQEEAVGTLFVTSERATPDILLPALRTGAKEFFQQPIVPAEVRQAFLNLQQQLRKTVPTEATPTVEGQILSVLGAKGGVGVTTFAVNLAASLQAVYPSQDVALIDLNRLVGEVPLFMDLATDFNWEEIGKNINRIDSAYLKSALVRHRSGVYVMPAPNWLEQAPNLPPGFLLQILRAMRQTFAAVVIDMGMYLDQEAFKILEQSSQIFLLSTLNLPCMINVKRIMQPILASGRIDADKIRVVANRYEKKTQISLSDAKQIIARDIATTIPNDYGLTMTAINNGKLLAEVGKNSTVVKAYQALAESLVQAAAPAKRRWRLFS